MIPGKVHEEPLVDSAVLNTTALARRLLWSLAGWYCLVGRLFPKSAASASDAVTTAQRFNASPEAVWLRIALYEEVRTNPPFLLRLFLPCPAHTAGDKTRVGASIRCEYDEGYLVKRITLVEPPHLMEFEVGEQRLGIETCITTLGGCYQIRACGDGSEAELVTNYRGHLRPRFLWRPVERYVARQLHLHILHGMGATLARTQPSPHRVVADCPAP
jgi:hypothetical protein